MHINCLLFPDITQLDLTGPFEVLARIPDVTLDLVAETMEPVRADGGLTILPTAVLSNARPCDLLLVPGGPGIDAILLEKTWVDHVRDSGRQATYIMGVCTGSLLLGAAGLLQGKRATSHWLARDLLAYFGADVSSERCCQDGNIFTAGGVTSGIDMALHVIHHIYGEARAQQIQLQLEYDPKPPFAGGTPFTSPPNILRACQEEGQSRLKRRTDLVKQAAHLF